jgi:hypothetical protein
MNFVRTNTTKMKRILLIVFMLSLAITPFATTEREIAIAAGEAINPFTEVWNAACIVESQGDASAYNDQDPNGGSHGIVQIGHMKLDDYNADNGTSYTLEDCYDVNISRKIFMWHYMQYGTDIETACKAWNGSGPMTEIYWLKVWIAGYNLKRITNL